MKTRHRAVVLLLGSIVAGISPGALADDDHAGWDRDAHWQESYRGAPQIEVIVDGLHIDEREQPVESADDSEAGATICHQAGGTIWSTRELPCEERIPPERSKVWSTSPAN